MSKRLYSLITGNLRCPKGAVLLPKLLANRLGNST